MTNPISASKKKPMIWHYLFPWETITGRTDSAKAYLDDEGYIVVWSDYGNYAHAWPHHGRDDFRAFFAQISSEDYLLQKHAPHTKYDGDATLDVVKTAILEMRRVRDIEKDEALALWETLDDYDQLAHERDFDDWCGDRTVNTHLDEVWEYRRDGHDSDAVHFVRMVVPALQAAIRAELLAEAEARARAEGSTSPETPSAPT